MEVTEVLGHLSSRSTRYGSVNEALMFCIRRNNKLHASLCLTHPSLYLQPVAKYIVVVAGCLLEGKAKQRIHLNPLAATFLQVSINHSLDALKPLLVSLCQYHNSVFGVCVLLF